MNNGLSLLMNIVYPQFHTIDDIVEQAKKGDDEEAYLAAFEIFVEYVNEGESPPDEIMKIVRDRLQMYLHREPDAIPKPKTKRRDSKLEKRDNKILEYVYKGIYIKKMSDVSAYRYAAKKVFKLGLYGTNWDMIPPTYKKPAEVVKKVWKKYGKAQRVYMKMQSQIEPIISRIEKYGIMKKEGK